MNKPHPTGCSTSPKNGSPAFLSIQKPKHEAQTEADRRILDEISGHIHDSVEGFFEKYFENKPLESPSTSLGGRSVFKSSLPAPRSGSASQHTSHLFLVRDESAGNDDYGWADVQVVGQFQEDMDDDYLQGFLRLYRHVQKVFITQPTRLFLHGFYVFGCMMQLWMFDRSGLYSCKPFKVDLDIGRLITIVAGYKRMSDSELGINMHIKEDKAGKYILFQNDDEPQCRLNLEDEPIAFPRRVVSQGPTCYKARIPASMDWEFVLKLSWRSNERSQEENILRLVKERKVWGVVQSFGHQKLDTISNLRKNLHFGVPKKLPLVMNANIAQSKTITAGPEIANASIGEVRPIVQEYPNDESIPPFDDLTFCCLVVSPLGRPLDKFDTTLEFLEGCRDAIKGHRSLYLDGKILHQDVSKDNIVIPEIKRQGEPRGILIDLDLAMELAVGPNKPEEIIGTKEFMAIGVLARRPHTYRHDLESFLYVFLWIAICGGHKRLPSESRLQRWLTGSWDVLAWNKTEDMAEENFRVIISEFSPAFKNLEGLAWDLRKVLFFPSPDGSLFIGTRYEPEEVQRLYEEMISAFDVAANFYAQRTSLAVNI